MAQLLALTIRIGPGMQWESLQAHPPLAKATIALWASALVGMAVGIGCAVDDRGMVQVKRYETGTASIVSLDAWGFHLITNAADAGVTVGHSAKVYYFEKPSALTHGASTMLSEDLELARSTPKNVALPARPLRDLGTPLAYYDRSAGVLVHVNEQQVGVCFGVQSRDALFIPRDFNGVLYFDWDGQDPAHSRAYIRKEAEP